MSRATGALGDDALDALFSGPRKTASTPGPQRTATPDTPSAPPAESVAPQAKGVSPPTAKRKAGRPRGANYGAKKGTRWKRSDGAEMRARSVHIPVEIDKQLRKRAAEEDKPVGQVIVELLERHLR